MNASLTLWLASLAICFLSLTARAQEQKYNDHSSEEVIISFVAAPGNFPDLGTLEPSESQMDLYAATISEWIAANELTFKNLVLSCAACKRISTRDVAMLGEPSIIRLKELINALAPALLGQIKGHEAYYPQMQEPKVREGEMTFLVSQEDFERIETHFLIEPR